MMPPSFSIEVTDAEIRDLHARLTQVRLPSRSPAMPGSQGVDLDWLVQLLDRWREFDWPAAQARLNRLPHYTLRVAGEQMHFLHFRSARPGATPLLLGHGWPGSFVELVDAVSLLMNPAAMGRPDLGPFDIVVPSLPGFGFSEAPRREGCSLSEMASRCLALMSELGYEYFVAQGGDFGASVAVCMARQAPARLLGLHLNFIPGTYHPPNADALAPEEQDFLAFKQQWADHDGAYAHIQGTKPQTLAYALSDSPAGLAAWIAEKFEAWSENGVPLHESNRMLDALLANLSIYWFTGTVASSMRLYWETRRAPLRFAPNETVSVPLGVAHFPHELPMPPRAWVARGFTNIRRWTKMPRGGHFAALEEPELFAAEVGDFVQSLRSVHWH